MPAAILNNSNLYLGQLFQTAKRPNAFLKLAAHFGGQTMGAGGFAYQETQSKEFPIGTFFTLPAPSQPAILEGANAPAPTSLNVSQNTNVVQLIQETISVSYLAEADRAVTGVVPIPQGNAGGQNEVQNPRSMEWQANARFMKVAQDLNYSFLNGAFVNPADPSTTALKTRGLLTAIVTTNIDNSADTSVAAIKFISYLETALASIVAQSGFALDEQYYLFCDATQVGNINRAFRTATGVNIYLQPMTHVAGIRIRQIETAYGTLNIVVDPDMPAQTYGIFNMSAVGMVGLSVPGRGPLFMEPLAKAGSADIAQIYGHLGIDHGPEYLSGKYKVPANVQLTF